MAEKRKRGQNFTTEEKDKIVKLLASYKDTILNKRTDGVTNEAKSKAWQELADTFNSSATVNRTKDSLIKLWEKMKTESKLYYQNSRRSITGTGGGPADVKVDPILEQVCALLGRACTGLLGVQDSDFLCDNINYSMENPYKKKICLEECSMPNATTSCTLNNETVEFVLEPIEEEATTDNNHHDTSKTDNETLKISKTPLWSRRRPQFSHMNERAEAVTNLCSSFTNINKKKEDIEDLKRQLLEEEITYKRKLYEFQLQTAELQLQGAAKELDIKTEIYNRIKGLPLRVQQVLQLGANARAPDLHAESREEKPEPAHPSPMKPDEQLQRRKLRLTAAPSAE